MVEAASESLRDGASCIWCGGKEEEAGGFCSSCGRVIAHVPPWALAGVRKRKFFTRRRLLFSLCLLLVAGFVFWLNFPFLPDPAILLFRRPTTNLTSQSLPGQWSMSGGNLQRTRNVEQVQQDVLGQILWSVDLGEPTFSEPIVLGSFALFALGLGTFILYSLVARPAVLKEVVPADWD